MKETLLHITSERKKLSNKYNERKKRYTPPSSENEQKEMHIKILICAIAVTVIVVLFAITNQ